MIQVCITSWGDDGRQETRSRCAVPMYDCGWVHTRGDDPNVSESQRPADYIINTPSRCPGANPKRRRQTTLPVTPVTPPNSDYARTLSGSYIASMIMTTLPSSCLACTIITTVEPSPAPAPQPQTRRTGFELMTLIRMRSRLAASPRLHDDGQVLPRGMRVQGSTRCEYVPT